MQESNAFALFSANGVLCFLFLLTLFSLFVEVVVSVSLLLLDSLLDVDFNIVKESISRLSCDFRELIFFLISSLETLKLSANVVTADSFSSRSL